MTPGQFTAELRRAGFEQVVEVEWPANGSRDEHSHPFESRALILEGEITLSVDGRETRCGCGETFHLPHGALHKERYGPSGVRYLVGRE